MTITDAPSLFDQMDIPPTIDTTRQDAARKAARRTDPETSVQAAEGARLNADTNRALALKVLREHPEGLSDFTLAEITGVQQASIGVRRGELVKAGLVAWSGRHGKSPSGASCRIWVAV